MTTAQQLGLVGNSVRVQALPTASAETFGQGNRYYTLIGQQEGYITGHTYHTVVANDVYSWEDVAQAGPQGEDGLPALVFNDTWGFINVGLFNAAIETFNRTPIVGEKVVIFSTENQYALATIESVSETTVGVRFSGPIIYTKGATGQQGPTGATGATGATGLVYKYTVATITAGGTLQVSHSNFNREPIVGETFVVFSRDNKYAIAEVTTVTPATIVIKYSNTVVSTKGETGAQGPQGEAGNAMYIYDGLLDSSVANVQVSQITIPTGRTLQAEDILISSYEGSVGAMAQVVAIADGVATVDFIGQISTGGSGGISDVKVAGTSVVTDGVANIPPANKNTAGVLGNGTQYIYGLKYIDNYHSGQLRFIKSDPSNYAQLHYDNGLVIRGSSASEPPSIHLGDNATLGATDITKQGIYFSTPSGQLDYFRYLAIRKKGASDYIYNTIPQNKNGELMCAPNTWSSGTSGSVTLSQAGTYQIYAVDKGINIDFGLIYTDLTSETRKSTRVDGSLTYVISIGSGSIVVTQFDTQSNTSETMTIPVYYRRVGI